MAKSPSWNAARSMLFAQRWTSLYEKGLAGDPQRHTLGFQRAAFFYRCSDAGVPRGFSRFPQARLAAANVLQTDRIFVRRARGGGAFRRIRRQQDVLLHVQPRESF